MKTTKTKKALRTLQTSELARVGGGVMGNLADCFDPLQQAVAQYRGSWVEKR